MAHQIPPLANAVANAANVLGTAAAVNARPAGDFHSSELPVPKHVPAPPAAAQLQGGLAGVRQTAEVVNVPKDPGAPGGPQVNVASVAGEDLPGVTDQLPSTATQAALSGADDAASAAVATRVGPEADPYHLAGP